MQPFYQKHYKIPYPRAAYVDHTRWVLTFCRVAIKILHVAGPCSPICIRHFHHYRAQQISAMFATQCAFAECRVQHRAEQDRDSSRVSCAVFARAHSSPISSCMTRRTSHVTRHTSHVTRHTSHVTRHTSHVTRHTSHVSRYMHSYDQTLPSKSSYDDG